MSLITKLLTVTLIQTQSLKRKVGYEVEEDVEKEMKRMAAMHVDT